MSEKRRDSALQITPDQLLQELIPVQAADEGAGIFVIRDIGGVLRDDIAHDLVV